MVKGTVSCNRVPCCFPRLTANKRQNEKQAALFLFLQPFAWSLRAHSHTVLFLNSPVTHKPWVWEWHYAKFVQQDYSYRAISSRAKGYKHVPMSVSGAVSIKQQNVEYERCTEDLDVSGESESLGSLSTYLQSFSNCSSILLWGERVWE